MKLDNNQQAFFALVRAGLWETEVQLAPFEKIDYQEVYRLAEEQSVVGLVTAGFDHVVDVKVPQEELLQFVGSSLQLEQTNLTMNGFVAQLIKKLRQNGIYALLVKGQGIAQSYERPLWRTSGDVDLLLDTDNYIKAKAYCDTIADSYSLDTEKNKERLHQEYQIRDWTVELHGTMHADLSRRMDCVIDQVQDETFSKKQVRVWKNGDTVVALPSPDNDVIFVFSHILQHLFFEGIGLRQICDWCRLLWTYKDTLNHGLLESRIRAMGVLSEWKILAAFAVKYLGMPPEAMPLCDVRRKTYEVRARRLMNFILEVGNFGHNREVKWSSPVKRRSMLIWHRIIDTLRLSFVFPVDAPKFLVKYVGDGVKFLVLENRGGAWNNSTC